jgi:hypothetical protein
MIRGGHTREREGKRRKLRIWLMYSPYKNTKVMLRIFLYSYPQLN